MPRRAQKIGALVSLDAWYQRGPQGPLVRPQSGWCVRTNTGVGKSISEKGEKGWQHYTGVERKVDYANILHVISNRSDSPVARLLNTTLYSLHAARDAKKRKVRSVLSSVIVPIYNDHCTIHMCTLKSILLRKEQRGCNGK
jgi:hypothetical protein